MTTGLVLIAAILVLGGVIATVGDRLGMRVGKARLTLFNLRPRQTATLITILTGAVISASTLGVLFAISENLRTGVFELNRIQRERRQAEDERNQARAEKEQTERRLQNVRKRQAAAQRRLEQINEFLKAAIEKQKTTQGQLNQAQTQLQNIQVRFQQSQLLIQTASRQAAILQSEIQQLQSDRQELIRQRDVVKEQIAQRDEEIAQRDRAIAEREQQLQALEDQRKTLAQEVQSLQNEFEGLRQGNVTLLRNQLMVSSAPFKIVDPNAAPQLIDQALIQANRLAIQRIQPNTINFSRQVIQISNDQRLKLVQQISDGQEYTLRIYSAGNYVIGEPCVLAGEACIQVFATAVPNQIVFRQGNVVASLSLNPRTVPNDALAEQILLLISAAQFRARQAGIVADKIQIAENSSDNVLNFFETLKQYDQLVDVQVIATDDVFTAGVARLELVATQNGQVLFGTR